MKQNILVLIIIISLLFYCQFVQLQTISFRFRIITWNVGNSEPTCKTFDQLAFASNPDGMKADLIIFGFQEASKNLIETNSFHKTLKRCLQSKNYVEMISDYVGSDIIKPIWLYIYISNITMQSQRIKFLKYKNDLTLKVHKDDSILSKVIGYKGVIAARIQIDKSTNLIFANMHLPAGEEKKVERCKLWLKFLQIYQANFFKDDYMFAFGDQNWRTSSILNIDTILEAIKKKEYHTILHNDELIQMRQKNSTETDTQCLSTFFEAPITFPPTYKYIPNKDEYQTQKNKEDRRPSYTDRILVSTLSKDLEIHRYSAVNDVRLSDHRPVFADIILHQRSTNKMNETSTKMNKTSTMKNDTKQPSKNNLFTYIIVIVIIATICALGILAIYCYMIKRQTRVDSSRQASSVDLASIQKNSEDTFLDG